MKNSTFKIEQYIEFLNGVLSNVFKNTRLTQVLELNEKKRIMDEEDVKTKNKTRVTTLVLSKSHLINHSRFFE